MKLLITLITLQIVAQIVNLVIMPASAQAASANGRMVMTVVDRLSIQAQASMKFSDAAPGSPAEKIKSGNEGQFSVQGAPNTTYTVNLPNEATLVNEAGDQSIQVENFSATTSGVLDASGSQTLSIAATRSALPTNLKAGTYSGSYTVEVVY